MIMSSGRSARLPPTPNAPSISKQRAAINHSTATAPGDLYEPNSNNVMVPQPHYDTVSSHMSQLGGSGSAGFGSPNLDIEGDSVGESSAPDLTAASAQVLGHLSENERNMIIEVLNRDENVRQRDSARLMELQAAGGDWMKDYTRGSCGAVNHLSADEDPKKSIRRSWTISNPEDDPNNPSAQPPVANNLYPQQQHLLEAQSAGSFPTLVRHQAPRPHPSVNYQTGSAIGISGIGAGGGAGVGAYELSAQRRILRQSTLPSTLATNDPNLGGSGASLANYNGATLTAPTSPHQLQRSPLYPSAYASDDATATATATAFGATDCDNYAQQLQQQQHQQQQQQQQRPQTPQQPGGVVVPQSQHRLQVRRQSTLPANPCQAPMYLSTSPSRAYSRSPERSPGEQRYPPFLRQTSIPCSFGEAAAPAVAATPQLTPSPTPTYPSPHHRPKLLPTALNYQPQPQPPQQQQQQQQQQSQVQQGGDEGGEYSPVVPKPRMLRQATLPNPEQHVKLLPTSPPKRQTSPQFRRSPEIIRQQTLPNPDGVGGTSGSGGSGGSGGTSGNSLTVQAPSFGSQGKFLPISPRHKQTFLFPNVQHPRQFLSQQHVAAGGGGAGGVGGDGEQYASSQSVNIHHSRDQTKMIKVRSHSNEEYSITKPHHPESRRLLPEIPAGRSISRSPSRLVRQECVKDERPAAAAAAAAHEALMAARTFGEAKQQFHQFQNVAEEVDNRPECADYFEDGSASSTFLEADEVLYESGRSAAFGSEPRIIYNDRPDDGAYQPYVQRPMTHEQTAEMVVPPEVPYGGYYGGDGHLPLPLGAGHSAIGGALPRTPQMHNRLRRRQSRDAQMLQDDLAQLNIEATVDGAGDETRTTATDHDKQPPPDRRKPEQRRSISEDSGAKSSVPKPTTRRSLSHPEKESQAPKKAEPTKIPSPKPLAEIPDKARTNTKIPTPRRRNSGRSVAANTDEGSSKSSTNERRNSDLTTKTSTQPNDQQQQKTLQQNLETEPHAKQGPAEGAARQPVTAKDEEQKDGDKAESRAQLGKQHTSTLGEQEIQNAVEAAAVIFKKVVLQRRQEKKAAEEEEAKAAAEELNRSPVLGQRANDPTSSPLQSRGSASSDVWPAQSDEDIDRLVAMHQNRSSLSSLGVRSDSMASVYSGAGEGRYGTVVVKGQVEFGMQYNYKLGALEIHVVRCKDLAAVDAKRNRSDPYVKVYLLPDRSKAGKRKTKVKKHTLNPIFDEVLRFHMPISNLESRTLWLTVWHSDMFGRNDFLGEVSVNLQGRVFDNPQSQWYLLQERSEPFEEVASYRGDIVVGLKYIPPEGSKTGFMRSTNASSGGSNLRKFGSIKSVASSKGDRSARGGQLHVLVKEAKHLSPLKPNGTCDAFCKSYLLPDRTRSSKQKTPVIKRSLHPSWNYTFVYEDVSLEDLSERALELTVWDHDRLASNEFLGGVRFSLGTGKSYGRQVEWMDATGKELSLWQNMLDRPNFWVEGSLVLRSTLDGIRATP